MLLTTSRGIWRQRRALNTFFSPALLSKTSSDSLTAVVGWGMKPNTERARALAARRNLPFWQLEDGFIGYIGHPASGATRLSLIVDEVGVYYDATHPSQLEQMLDNISWWHADWQHRAEQLRTVLVAMGSSLKLCLVAEGAADTYPRLGPTSLWDTGAAQCVVEQAGGTVVQLNGEPLSYLNTREVLNPFFLVLGQNDVNWPALFN